MRFIRPTVKSLSGLTIGLLTLTPEFSSTVLEYTAATSNATNKITATATDSGDTVTILNGETPVTSGESATWSEGENEVTITVADRDDPTSTTVYEVTVTYTAPVSED